VVADGAGAPGTVLDRSPAIACGSGAIRLVEVQRAGKKPMSGADLMRGFDIGRL
jgi:methionyl-tRNA formyltransferase